MPSVNILKWQPIVRTPRVMQIEGMFDIPRAEKSTETFNADLPIPEEWNIGMIVGPSGCGKTTIAREVFGEHFDDQRTWSDSKSVLDDFPEDMSIKDIAELLSSVGFSSPPSWLRPYRALSNGEQFRVNVARTLAESKDIAVIDEFTSVVDRTVAQIGSAAVAKAVRRKKKKLVAVSCHCDIIEWLQPDWIFEPATNTFQRRLLRRHPPINLEVKRCHHSAWQLFRKHHYLNTELNNSAKCFVALFHEQPVAFSSWVALPHRVRGIRREHRTVVLPDFQGVGIGNSLSAYIASIIKANGLRPVSTTSHPAMIWARNRSSQWSMTSQPMRHSKENVTILNSLRNTRADKRLVASFEYVGPPCVDDNALGMWS